MRKWLYVAFIGGLTSTAASAFYWQLNRCIQADLKWSKIKKQLNNQSPESLNSLSEQQKMYAFKYLSITGHLSDQFHRIQRIKNGRMGYLIVRSLKYKTNSGQDKQIAALQGWCQANYQYKLKIQQSSSDKQFKGILRQKEKKDYIHQKMPQSVLQKYNLNTYINLQQILARMNIKGNRLNENYYFQILRPLDEKDVQPYPYQYSVDNFQLPYLTPDKHASYAAFWLITTLVGLSAIRIVLKFK